MDGIAGGIIKVFPAFIILFLVIAGPAYYGQSNASVYYDLGATLPEDMEYVIATNKLQDEFDMSSTHMILADAMLPESDARSMTDEIKQIKGVKTALSLDSLIGNRVPEAVIPDSLREILKGDKYQLMLIGEAPCTKDLISITNRDFQVVDAISIIAIFVIIAIVLKSISLPFILVAVIEFAIFINLGIPYYTGTQLPFIAPICISTIQLGATVDYAILMTSRYKLERVNGADKKAAIKTALSTSIGSIAVSALGFFAATFGVALYSDVDIIGSLCMLMARGALISMFSVVLVLPSLFMVFDKLICKTTAGMRTIAN